MTNRVRLNSVVKVVLPAKTLRERLITGSKTERVALLYTRPRISLLHIAEVTGLRPEVIDLWRRDIPGFWKALEPAPSDPPIRPAYSDHVRVEFYMEDLRAWLATRSRLDGRRNYLKWFEAKLEFSKDPAFARKRELERNMERRAYQAAIRNVQFYGGMPATGARVH